MFDVITAQLALTHLTPPSTNGRPTMQHTLRFRACTDTTVLLEEHTIAYGLVSGYQRCAEELGVLAGRQVRVELLDHNGHLLDWRTYVVSETGARPDPAVHCVLAQDAGELR